MTSSDNDRQARPGRAATSAASMASLSRSSAGVNWPARVARMEGGIGFGLSAALFGAVTIKDGVVQETNFDSYPVVRMNEMPSVETYILPSTNRPTGMGEPGVPPIAPAIANAVFALTDSPTNSLPMLQAGVGNAGFSLPDRKA